MKMINQIFLLMCLITIGYTDLKAEIYTHVKIDMLETEVYSFKNSFLQNGDTTKQKIIPFMTFQKEDAEQAMNFYIEMFDNSEIVSLTRWGKDGPGKEGTIMHAAFTLNGLMFMCSDSPPIHDWDFSPAISNFVECEDEGEIDRLFSKLAEKGTVTMPLNNYGFSQKFGWVIDQFGISWQLNLD